MSLYIGTRDVVTVAGPDAATYLQGQVSQDLVPIAVGSSAWSLILQPQGKVDAFFRITRDGDESYLLDVDEGWGEALRARLQRFLLRMKVELTLETWDFHAYRDEVFEGSPDAAPIVAAVDWNGAGTDVVGPSLVDPGRPSIDRGEFDRLRILAGMPAMGSELDDATIPAESRIIDMSVSFTKGCYTGQELVARIDSRGNNTPRSLHRVRGAGAAPSVGDELRVEDDVAGVVTSAVPAGDDWVGLAYLKRKFEAPLEVRTSSGAASVELIDRV